MNYAIVFRLLGYILMIEGTLLLLPAVTSLLYAEWAVMGVFLLTAAISGALGFALQTIKPRSKVFYMREGFAATALSWITISIMGAVPFVLTGCIPNPVDAMFETVSGFTTTGASILPGVEGLPNGILFWRSFTHWIGGMGVFVFIMAILPMMGGSTMNLMRAESPGPSVSKLVPRVRDTAKILYGLYMAITVLGVIMLCLCGMPLFDSLCTTFGSVGTGGFGVKNSSIGGYSPLIQNAVTILMILSGVNYTVYFCLLSRQFKEAFSIEEVRWYFLIIFASALTIAWNIRPLYATLGETLRHSFFQVGTIITTTGFATTDFNMWPQLSKTILLLLMMIGACAGSTGGGIKVSRVLILFKAIRKELSMMIHPRMVKKIKMDGHNLSHETLRSTNVYMTAYFIVLFVSLLIVCLDEYDLSTNFTAVLATLNNIGPGLELVGPTQNFALFSPLSKCVLMFDMLAGRLELFPMLVILLPSCWKKY
jgi:trk system potassium uptake protein TrkH